MVRTAGDLKGASIAATDGDIGSLQDLYFDDRSWTVRYLVVDTGRWLPGRRVLISPISVRAGSDPSSVAVALTKDQVKNSPSVDTDKPAAGVPAADIVAARETNGDPSLRSARDLIGYNINTTDGGIGHVEDFLLDDREWAIRYMIIDTRNWWPGKQVLVSPAWISRVSWPDSRVHVNLTKGDVKTAPEYDPNHPLGCG